MGQGRDPHDVMEGGAQVLKERLSVCLGAGFPGCTGSNNPKIGSKTTSVNNTINNIQTGSTNGSFLLLRPNKFA